MRAAKPVELKAAGSGGKHGIAYVVFLADPPEPRALPLEVRDMVAKVDPDQPGRVTLSWTTSWPCLTRLKWNAKGKEPQNVEQGPPCLVHRVVLEGLDATASYEAQAIGEGPEGEPFAGEPIDFRADESCPNGLQSQQRIDPAGGRQSASLRGRVVAHLRRRADATRSVGRCRNGTTGRRRHGEVPVQVQTTARWPDGSVKWLLLNFTADVPAKSEAEYRLEYGSSVEKESSSHRPLTVVESAEACRSTPAEMQFAIDSSGNINHSGIYQTVAEDTEGTLYRTAGAKAEITVEERGPIRAVIKTVAPLIDKDGNELFLIEKRIEAYRKVRPSCACITRWSSTGRIGSRRSAG